MSFENFIILFSLIIVNLNLACSLSPCKTDLDCKHGSCNTTSGNCTCNTGYVNYNDQPCDYEQKEKLTAFLLSFLIGTTGADWFYLSNGKGGYITAGVFKLLTGIAGIIG